MPEPHGDVTGKGVNHDQEEIENMAGEVQHSNDRVTLFKEEDEISDHTNECAVGGESVQDPQNFMVPGEAVCVR